MISLVEFLIFVLCTYGICFGFIQKCEIIYKNFNFLSKMAECEYCTGFWAGLIAWFLVWGFKVDYSWGIISICISHAFSGAALCYLIDAVYKRIEEVSEEFEDEDE
jgi:hypothetical protein